MGNPIPTAEKAKLASAMSTGILSAVVDAVMESHNLKQAIWEQFLKEMDRDVDKLCDRQNHSVLANNSIDHLKSFQWNEIIREMDQRVPRVLDILLVLLRPDEKSFPSVVDQIVRRTCVSYAVLLQSRKCEFSLIQRAITVILSEGGSSKRVSEIAMTSVCTWSKTFDSAYLLAP